jgi:hypothetical protein
VKTDGQSGLMLFDDNGTQSIALHSKSEGQKASVEIRTEMGKKRLL